LNFSFLFSSSLFLIASPFCLRLFSIVRADSISQAHLLWADKYKPKASTELVGNLHLIDRIRAWLADWYVAMPRRREVRKWNWQSEARFRH
jgi:hypothetical protein